MIKVLFVCTGNICRSPTAEGVFRHLVKETGLEGAFLIDSAGTYSGHAGDPPDARAIETAGKHGVDISDLKARGLENGDFENFDYIYALDGGHLREITRRAPKNPRARLLPFIEGRDVPDPWYGGMREFEHAFGLIHEGCGAILRQLREEKSRRAQGTGRL